MPSAGFETAIPLTEPPENYALNRTATGNDAVHLVWLETKLYLLRVEFMGSKG